MCLSISFLIIPWAPIITGTVGVSLCDIIAVSILSSFYLLRFYIRRLVCYYLLALTYQLRYEFFFIVLNYYINTFAFYFSNNLDDKLSENKSSFGFCSWFWLRFILFLLFQYSLDISNEYNVLICKAFLYILSLFIIIIVIIRALFVSFSLESRRQVPSGSQCFYEV